MGLQPITDSRVRTSVRWLFTGAGLIFLITVGLGIANVLMTSIPRGQVLAHLHAGTIGWITLSVIATAMWAFTGARPVTDGYATGCRWLAGGGVVAVAGYVGSFGLAFAGNGPFWLLPLFGIPTGLVILGGLLVTATQMRHLATVTTPHLLLTGALLVATLGATMGILVGLTYNGTNVFPSGEGVEPVGAHAGPMDMYLVLAFAAILEILLVQGPAKRWRWPGMTQTVLGVLAGFTASLALFLGIGPLIPAALLLLLGSFAFYLVRIGWRVVTVNPAGGGADPALFFGGIGFPIYVGLFVYLIATYFAPGNPLPHVLGVVFTHTTFVLAGTNLVLAIQSAHAPGPGGRGLEFYGYWVLNLGVLAFFASEIVAGRKDGALIMGLGILFALFAVGKRLLQPRASPM